MSFVYTPRIFAGHGRVEPVMAAVRLWVRKLHPNLTATGV